MMLMVRRRMLGSGDDVDGKKENVAEATAKSYAGFTRIVRLASLVQWLSQLKHQQS
jgi:hypothetical protein